MIWATLKGLLGGVWGYIAAGLAALAGVILVLSKAKKAGRDEVVADSLKKQTEKVTKAKEAENEVSSSDADARRKRLRDKWTVG